MYEQIKSRRKISPRTWTTKMRKDKEYVDEIFIQLTANYLKREIIILPWNQNDDLNKPFQSFAVSPIDNEGNHVVAEGTFYLLYYPESWFGAGSHYQSIRKIDNFDLTNQRRYNYFM